ncbi:Glyoxalase/bleomycin resistance protein/dioxygenase-like protein [Podospora didyma]|uniref:Glyoxalase/bleomycin resistance protein/dioxygenase-like protein n=1 Tax=Podospora didyma TaxID=330526 RepID=A0AAE0K0H9_9PEZI|nr:Glyoxalase/bleomycin resistance protein/dioxygenase-like protein [Podospora didyma]
MPISHTGVTVSTDKFKEVIAWYTAALAPLGYAPTRSFADGNVIGFGCDGVAPDWWVVSRDFSSTAAATPGGTIVATHHAFRAKDQETVKAFHEAALAAGGKDNGAPGPRPQYGPTNYGAFVFDPAGNNIEAVHGRD